MLNSKSIWIGSYSTAFYSNITISHCDLTHEGSPLIDNSGWNIIQIFPHSDASKNTNITVSNNLFAGGVVHLYIRSTDGMAVRNNVFADNYSSSIGGNHGCGINMYKDFENSGQKNI